MRQGLRQDQRKGTDLTRTALIVGRIGLVPSLIKVTRANDKLIRAVLIMTGHESDWYQALYKKREGQKNVNIEMIVSLEHNHYQCIRESLETHQGEKQEIDSATTKDAHHSDSEKYLQEVQLPNRGHHTKGQI